MQNPKMALNSTLIPKGNAKIDSLPNYSVQINGKHNFVTITSDSLKVQTTETLNNKPNAINTIEISGQGNNIAVSQKNRNDKVEISQNGNNNSVKIVQSTHKPN
jgi:hypothetical protein